MNNKLRNLLILFVLCIACKVDLIFTMYWEAFIALEQARKMQDKKNETKILLEWEQTVQKMTEQNRIETKKIISKIIDKIEDRIKQFDINEEYRKQLLRTHPRMREILLENLQIYWDLKAPFDALP